MVLGARVAQAARVARVALVWGVLLGGCPAPSLGAPLPGTDGRLGIVEPRLPAQVQAQEGEMPAAAPAPSAAPPRLPERDVTTAAPEQDGATAAPQRQAALAYQTLLQRARRDFEAGRHQAALVSLHRAAALPGLTTPQSADVWYRIGRAELRLQRPDQALAAFDRSLGFVDRLEPRFVAALRPLSLHGRAEALRARGQPREARQEYERARVLYARAGHAAGEAASLAEIGSTWLDEADFSAAFTSYERARALRRADGSAALGDGRLLVNMSSLYSWMGRYGEALALQAEAVRGCGAQRDALCLASAAQAEGFTRHLMGDYAGAEAAAARAVQALGPAPTVDRARALNNLGLSRVEAGRGASGLQPLREALSLVQRVGDRRDIATATDSLGTAYRRIGDHARAEIFYRRALLLWRQTAHIEGQRDTLANLGRLAADRGQPEVAILHLKNAVNLAQRLRTSTRDMSADMRAGLTRRLEPTYTLLAGLLTEQGRLSEAREVTAMLKEQELYELVRGADEADPRTARVPLTGLEARLQKQDDAITEELAATAAALAQIEQQAAGAPLDAAARARRAELERRLAAGGAAFERYLSALEPLFTRLDEASRRDAEQLNLAAAEGLQKSLRKLGRQAVLLHYVVLDDELKIILTSSHAQRGYSVRIGRVALNQAIGELRRDIDRRADVRPAARRLYDLLLAPVRQDLDTLRAQTLMLALTGTLRYLPFAALHDGSGWLAERYALALYTEAARQNIEAAPISPWRLQAFGVARRIEGFSQLTAVAAEIDAIVEPLGLPGTKRMDEDFTADSFREAVDSRPPVLHVASHFVFRPGTEADSFLLLGDGRRLSLADFKAYRFDDLDLMTLSACETAVGGGRNENGREIEGLAAMVQKRGANAVLASLWPVADGSTAVLMQHFYTVRQRNPALSKADALQAAQRALLAGAAVPAAGGTAAVARGGEVETAGDAPAAAPPAGARYAHPYYWAPFVLMGNWR